ncbi:hypothetical protein [Streptomyces sp. NPDC057428]|uniref:hypothetical protein n=1 Tax=Streptomyces sp. NPDC057428 TaxID=3346129 RepID=UPI003694AAA3
MAKILLTSTPFQGHVAPIEAIAADLTSRGHDVLVYTGARFEERMRRTGARFAPYAAEVDYDDRDLDASFPGREHLAPVDRFNFDLKHVLAGAIPAHDERIQKLLMEFPASVVMGEVGSFGLLPMALRAPRGRRPLVVTVSADPPLFDSVDTAPYGPGLPPPAVDEDRARYEGIRQDARAMFADGQQHVERVFASMGVTLPDFIFNACATVPDHMLQLTVPEFEYPRSDAPEGFRCIGPLPPAPESDFQLPEWWHDLPAGRPVVVVTQGTLENGDLSQLLIPTLRALADTEVTVIAATARPDGPSMVRAVMGETVPGNARVAGFVPFDRLLPHADLLITNAGYGGVQTALRHGVPLAAAAMTPVGRSRSRVVGGSPTLERERPTAGAFGADLRRWPEASVAGLQTYVVRIT